MKMKISKQIHLLIIAGARTALELLTTEEVKTAAKSARDRELDTIFARHPSDVTWRDLAEVVKNLTGYRPVVVPEARQNFQVMIRPGTNNQNDRSWIILKGNQHGFGDLGIGCYQIDRVDRLATPKETEKFIAHLEKLDSEQFMTWIVRNLGAEFVASL